MLTTYSLCFPYCQFENTLEIWEPIGKLRELDENTLGNF
jgi:hypothetical protein